MSISIRGRLAKLGRLPKPLARRLRTYVLPAVVFTTGACILIVELIATRILSPFYGNTIFTVSSIIGIVLAALSIGYYVGGRLADKRPDARIFYGIIALGGISVLLLHVLTISLLPYLSRVMSITTGPLVTSLALFLVPAILLGMLSPYAIKLQQALATDKGIGTIAGEMFFWSTLGSIAGSLSTGFLLTPLFGVDHIILGVGLFLIALGVIPLIFMTGRRFRALGALLLAGAVIFALQVPVVGDVIAKPANTLYSKDGLYEKLTIYDGEHEGRPARFFQQDRSHSGAMYLDSDELVYDYTKYYTVHKLFNQDPRQTLVIGGGAYSIPKKLLQDLPQAQVDVSEIEPSLYDLSKQYFRVQDSPRLANFTEDGRRMLAKSDKRYDLIFSDVYYSFYSVPAHFTTKEFFELSRDRLTDDGVFVGNFIGNLTRRDPSFILSEMRTFREVFPNSYFFATRSPSSTATQNIMFVASNSQQRLDLQQVAADHADDPILGQLAARNVDPGRFSLADYPVLTDDYAPVEHLIAPFITNPGGDDNLADGDRMLALIRQQLSYGPRHVGSPGHTRLRDFIRAESTAISADTSLQHWQETSPGGTTYDLHNVILRTQPDNPRRIIVGTHYDSKTVADLDDEDPSAPMPGANDGASGVAVLLESARVLAQSDKQPAVGVDFVFFDGEEGLPGAGTETGDWKPYGSEHFADTIAETYPGGKPEGGIVVDMVCDRNLAFKQDTASLRAAPSQTRAFWDIGNRISPGTFQPANGQELIDDHTALNRAGIPSFLVIDFEYPPFHTRQDTIDKCSADSLQTTSRTLLAYLGQLK